MPPVQPSVLSTKVHAVLDYGAALVLIGSPWLVGFASHPQARWVTVLAGVLLLLLAMVTRYEGGLFKRVPIIIHLGLDRIIGSLLGASPWLLGFANWCYWPQLSLGLLLFLVGLITEWKPAYK